MIAIVGAGAAAWSAARTLRGFGHDDSIAVFGAEALAPYERPTLSKSYLTAPEPSAPPTLVADALGVDLRLRTSVVAVHPEARTLTTAQGDELTYDQLLLATGAACRRLALDGADLRGVHYLREAIDADALRAELRPGRRLAVIGGGVIGLEVAASARERGVDVTVIEAAPRVLSRVAPDAIAAVVVDRHRACGVTIRTGSAPTTLEGRAGHVSAVHLDDGSAVAVDCVVVGVGAVPRTELASRAGLAVDDGIVVDTHFRTSDPFVFAAGDAARVLHARLGRFIRTEQWQVAERQGEHAAASMLGRGAPYTDVPWMWSDQHDLHLEAAGHGFGDTETVRLGSAEERTGIACLGLRDGRLVAACGVSRGTGIARLIRLAQQFIASEQPLDVEQLAAASDPARALRALLRVSAR